MVFLWKKWYDLLPIHIMYLFVYSMSSCEFLALLCLKGEKHCISIALGRRSAMHTYILIQLYFMMMMIWFDTYLSV